MLPESVDTAASINGVYILARNLQDYLGHFTFNLFAWNHDDVFKVSLLGSATPLLYRENFFVICTRHQFKNHDPKDISVVTDDGEFAVTSSGYSAPKIGPEGLQNDLQDIAVFNFNGACNAHPSIKRRFFRVTSMAPDCIADSVIAVLNYGFPCNEQLYELEERNHIGSRRRGTTLTPHSQPSDETLLCLKASRKLTFDPDGLSGGPNFVVQRDNAVFSVYFAGVTVRAGSENFFIVKSGYIIKLLDAVIDSRA